MKLVRTRNSEIEVDFKEAVLNPSTDDNSLYAPKILPKFNLKDLKNLSYKQFALKLIQSFEFNVDDEVFKKALDSYEQFDDKDCPIYIFKVSENLYINELYHGPTRAFKDMALQPFGVLLDELSKDKKFLILCATSGDTGPATLKAFENKDNIKIVCIYPHLGTSEIQALQMNTMQAKNLKVMPISGDFDTAQNILKTLLNDKNFSDSLSKLGYCLSVANSVNFARILFQTIYHYYVSLKLNKTIDIIVPSGNFGNALAAYYAKKIGANIDKIKIASNSNNILSDFFTKGEYDLRGRMLIKTISPAMDILISSNIERLIFDKFGDKRCKELFDSLKEYSFFQLKEDELQALKEDFEADFCSDIECKEYIKKFSITSIIDPHTATCFKLIDKNKTQVICSTAEWTKFTPSMYEALFGTSCHSEMEAMIDIAERYEIGIKVDILDLFDKKKNELKIYESKDLKDNILEWIKK